MLEHQPSTQPKFHVQFGMNKMHLCVVNIRIIWKVSDLIRKWVVRTEHVPAGLPLAEDLLVTLGSPNVLRICILDEI